MAIDNSLAVFSLPSTKTSAEAERYEDTEDLKPAHPPER